MVHYRTRYKYNSREPVSSPRDVILIKDSLVDLYRVPLTRPVSSRVPIYTVISLSIFNTSYLMKIQMDIRELVSWFDSTSRDTECEGQSTSYN